MTNDNTPPPGTQRAGIPLRQRIARVVALLLLLPAGLVCVATPFWMLTLPGRAEIIDDTLAAFGAGTDGGRLRAAYVDCVAQRSGSSSSRGIGMTEYGCVIDLTTEPAPEPAGQGGDPYAGLTPEEAMAKHSRSMNAGIEALAAQRRARGDGSNRLERKLATNRTGQLPTVRILSAEGQPRRIGLVWGFGEIAWRWGNWLVTSLIFFSFAAACLFAVWIAWMRRVPV